MHQADCPAGGLLLGVWAWLSVALASHFAAMAVLGALLASIRAPRRTLCRPVALYVQCAVCTVYRAHCALAVRMCEAYCERCDRHVFPPDYHSFFGSG